LTTVDFVLAAGSVEKPAPPRESLARIGRLPAQRLVAASVVAVAMQFVRLLPKIIPDLSDECFDLPFDVRWLGHARLSMCAE
jgi:hypothetical protein